jgi:hypothetical protein
MTSVAWGKQNSSKRSVLTNDVAADWSLFGPSEMETLL